MSKINEEYVERAFDLFCKRVIRNAAYDYFTKQQRKLEHEAYLVDCFSEPYTEDSYCRDDSTFDVCGFVVELSDQDLVDAINRLPQRRKDIILLTCCLDLSDSKVAPLVKSSRRTVAYQRACALADLRGYLQYASIH